MKKHLFYLSSFVLILIGSSCQKDADGSGDSGTEQPDNTVLERMVIKDTGYATGSDTLYKYEFSYDAQKRPSLIKITGYYQGTPTIEYEVLEKRFYNGTSVYPY